MDGELLHYGDEVLLLDEEGMVWNNIQGRVGGIGPNLIGSRGEMHVMFRKNKGDGSMRVMGLPSSRDKVRSETCRQTRLSEHHYY